MKIILFFFLLSFCSFSQTKGIVKDEAGNPIPFVSILVENETIGVSSEEDGSFSIAVDASKNLVFSAVGYETKTVKVTEAKNVQLPKKVFELGEVVISPAKKQKTVKIGDDYGRGEIRYYSQQTTAKHFAYTKEAKNHPFLKEITIYTKSKIDNAKINLRVLKANQDGSPGEDILEENYIILVKNGGKNTTVDMQEFHIEIPAEGIFIAIEALKINENKFYKKGPKYKDITGNIKRMDTFTYEPFFGYLPSKENTCWYFSGNWMQGGLHKMKNPKSYENLLMKKYHDHYLELAMSITLTN